MSNIKNGGPAFPVVDTSHNTATGETTIHQAVNPGMSLRDYFAGKAIAAVLADPYFSEKANRMGYGEFAGEAAKEAYAVADAMLKAREQS